MSNTGKGQFVHVCCYPEGIILRVQHDGVESSILELEMWILLLTQSLIS